jgi:hypothetical protein
VEREEWKEGGAERGGDQARRAREGAREMEGKEGDPEVYRRGTGENYFSLMRILLFSPHGFI